MIPLRQYSGIYILKNVDKTKVYDSYTCNIKEYS